VETVVLPVLTGTGGAQAGTGRRKFGDLGSKQPSPKPALAEPRLPGNTTNLPNSPLAERGRPGSSGCLSLSQLPLSLTAAALSLTAASLSLSLSLSLRCLSLSQLPLSLTQLPLSLSLSLRCLSLSHSCLSLSLSLSLSQVPLSLTAASLSLTAASLSLSLSPSISGAGILTQRAGPRGGGAGGGAGELLPLPVTYRIQGGKGRFRVRIQVHCIASYPCCSFEGFIADS
jgi:hypothetical protein